MGQEKSFRVGWVIVSYFMISGGIMVALSLMGIMKVVSLTAIYAMCFPGAALGGFFAGRASPGKTILEPAVAGVLLFGTFVALMATVPGARFIWKIGGDALMIRAVGMGALMAAGGLVGAYLGERSSDGTQSSAKVRWMGISALIALGTLFFLFMVLAILLLRQEMAAGASLTDDEGTTVVLLAMAGSALVGGAATQAVAPSRMLVASGAGFMCVMFALYGIAATASPGGVDGKTFGGLMIIGVGGWIVGIGAAALTWLFVRKGKQQTGSGEVAKAFE